MLIFSSNCNTVDLSELTLLASISLSYMCSGDLIALGLCTCILYAGKKKILFLSFLSHLYEFVIFHSHFGEYHSLKQNCRSSKFSLIVLDCCFGRFVPVWTVAKNPLLYPRKHVLATSMQCFYKKVKWWHQLLVSAIRSTLSLNLSWLPGLLFPFRSSNYNDLKRNKDVP